jgi:hypothetical protein
LKNAVQTCPSWRAIHLSIPDKAQHVLQHAL